MSRFGAPESSRALEAEVRVSRSGVWRAGGASVILAVSAAPALGQTMNTSDASFNIGYGRTVGQENRPVSYSTLDANSNQTVINGLIGGSKQSDLGSETATVSGLGGASAIGNQLNVIVQGDHNTVVVSSTQTNTGAITAITKVDATISAANPGKGS